jgi:hypothetical protein
MPEMMLSEVLPDTNDAQNLLKTFMDGKMILRDTILAQIGEGKKYQNLLILRHKHCMGQWFDYILKGRRLVFQT